MKKGKQTSGIMSIWPLKCVPGAVKVRKNKCDEIDFWNKC